MERHEIRPAAWKLALLVAGMVGFTILGVVLLVYADSFVDKMAGVLCVAFFGGFGSLALYAMRKGQGRLAVLPNGLEYSMFSGSPRVIPWADIESIGTLKISKQKFTAIRLRNYASLVNGLSDQEAERALKQFGAMRAMSIATVAVGVAGGEKVGDLVHYLGGSGRVKSVVEMLQFMREKYGAEVFLPWNLRDRSAEEFAKYLNECRSRTACS